MFEETTYNKTHVPFKFVYEKKKKLMFRPRCK